MMMPNANVFVSSFPLPLTCDFAMTAMMAQHTPRTMNKSSIARASFTGSLVHLLAVRCVMKVASGRHERMIRFTERGKSEILKLLSAMFIVKEKEKRTTASHSIFVLSFFGVYPC